MDKQRQRPDAATTSTIHCVLQCKCRFVIERSGLLVGTKLGSKEGSRKKNVTLGLT
jgi:hypothetical protein